MYYWPILAVLGAGALLVALVFLLAARLGRAQPMPYDQVTPKAYRIRFYWFCVLCAVLALALAASLTRLPYPAQRAAALPAGVRVETVDVSAAQYTWSLEGSLPKAGGTAAFLVTSTDVNHGFGVYDPTGQLIGQTQAMPGYTNRLLLTLDLPGDYTIRCLEYCGEGHSSMLQHFQVGACSTANGC